MYIEEKAHYSLIYKLKDQFGNRATVSDSFPRQKLTVPTVTFNLTTVDFTKLQIGNYNNIRELSWLVDVFGKNKTQRDSLVFELFSVLENKVPIFDYSLGFPPVTVPEIGALNPTKLRIELVDIEIEETEEIQYRAAGLYTAEILVNL